MPSQPLLRQLVTNVQQHFHQVIVPLWLTTGWNAELALPYEALNPQGQPLPPQRYRAMACARQLYVFSQLMGDARHPYAAERAAALFRSLNKHFLDTEYGGWIYSINPQGSPLDSRKDLYTHAFILFACAHYWRVSQDPLAESTMNAALEVIDQQFSDEDGLFHAELSRDWCDLGTGALQNPLMHLTEALLAVLQARADEHTEQALQALCSQMLARFVVAKTGLLLEKPLGSASNWFEPGHQFEWLYLLQTSALLRQHPLHEALAHAVELSLKQGVSSEHGVYASLDANLQLLDATQRIWAQTEYLRALTLRKDAGSQLVAAVAAFSQRYLHPYGWSESLDEAGKLNRADMPSTTAYHLLTSYQALDAFLAAAR